MKKERVALFDILKGVAIIMVCITHFSWEKMERLAGFFPWWISMAVPIFMLVTGYLTAASYERKHYSFPELYQRRAVVPKLVQYLCPFAIMFVAELVLHPKRLHLPEIVHGFLTGGLGKYGTYYVPILLQMLVLFPLVYALLRRNKKNIVWCFLANLLFELSKDSLGITKSDYRLLAVRYVFMIAMGCYLYFERGSFRMKTYLPMFILGVFYVFLASYAHYQMQIFTRWRTTSMMTAFYMAPVVALLLARFRTLRAPLLERVGKASYHIFLFQILYYNYLQQYLPVSNRMVNMALGVLLCLAGGCLFEVAYGKLSAALRGIRLPRKKRRPVPVS